MKTRILALLGFAALVLGDAGELQAAQRGSRGSSASPSRGASVSPSRGSSSRGSFSSPSRSSSFQGSRGSSTAPRPSSSGASRPSVAPTPSRTTQSVRPSVPQSVRPSTPQTIRPSTSPSRVTPSVPGARSSVSPGSSLAPGSSGAPSAGSTSSGRSLYSGRAIEPGQPGSTRDSVRPYDSAPTAGPTLDSGLVVPSQRTQPRVRFPAPYSPAGAVGRSATPGRTRSIDVAPQGRTSVAPGAGRVTDPGSLSTRGTSVIKGQPQPEGRDVRPLVRYDRGPTGRGSVSGAAQPDSGRPKSIAPESVRPKASAPKPSGVVATPSRTGKSSGVTPGPKAIEPGTRSVTSWRDVRRNDPQASKEISVTSKLAGRGHSIATGVAAGAIGGVYPGSWRGGSVSNGSGWYCDPGYSSGWGWSWSIGISSSWCWWSYPAYWSWYYPCYWWYSRPYYYYDYAYYPAATVVYADPQVVYVESEPAYVEEPVGEAVVEAPRVSAPAPAPEESPLSIAAQRYLELGDRAFREGRYTDAVQFYAKAVEFAPDQGALYLVLSDALFAAGDYHYGAYSVRRALELDPALLDSQVDKHAFYPDPAQFDQQLADLERYLDQNPTDRDARLVLAINYLFGGRPADAARMIEGNSATMGQDEAAQQVLAQARANAGR
jgi:hypothetical protein